MTTSSDQKIPNWFDPSKSQHYLMGKIIDKINDLNKSITEFGGNKDDFFFFQCGFCHDLQIREYAGCRRNLDSRTGYICVCCYTTKRLNGEYVE